jgi:galactokinase/mevalonate kinase-like predicted kinase
MHVSPETAADFGVFFAPRHDPSKVAFFLQKPKPETIRELAADHAFYVDTGLWLLSARAVDLLMKKCGWTGEGFAGGAAGFYELYAGMGPSLGSRPVVADPEIAALSCAVVPLPMAEFYHFGTTRQMIESLSDLQNRSRASHDKSDLWRKPHPDMYVLNSDFAFHKRTAANRNVWIENSSLPADFEIASENALTGVRAGDWTFGLKAGDCVDFVPVGAEAFAVRNYGFDDSFSGPLAKALWLGRPAADWLAKRGITMEEAGLSGATDIQESALFAVVEEVSSEWVSWLLDEEPEPNEDFSKRWRDARRLSARELGEEVNLARLYEQRRGLTALAIGRFWEHRARNPFFQIDLENAAGFYAATLLPDPDPVSQLPLDRSHEEAFASAVIRLRGRDGKPREREAFAVLARRIISMAKPVNPKSTLMDDQILWARSPVRLDLAGGWTDTPPFCVKHGGAVVNLAVDLNGQAPVQVFVRRSAAKRMVIRSIDLGAESVIGSVDELADCSTVGAEFSLAKAALCLAGFHPDFRSDGASNLGEILESLGGGIEISLLAATPKGSGLGTSSALAATLLAALGSSGGLDWDREEVFQRTLALEQMLTSGGGWQDQAGSLYEGIKLIETAPGFEQTPSIRWLPEHLLGPRTANNLALLYYTGITRVAKTILADIVRGMLLNNGRHLENLFAIRDHALVAYQSLQRQSWDTLCDVVARSWELNQALDSGTNPPAVAAILDQVSDWTAGAKLLGAGGGGYMLLLAKDAAAAGRIRRTLEENPPNAGARFVDFQISPTGLQITRS